MKLEVHTINGIQIAEVQSDQVEICSSQDALNLMANCNVKGAKNIIVHVKNIVPDFFDLSTGIADEVLQKFSNYNSRVAIVGDFSKFPSTTLNDFMKESNRVGEIHFAATVDEAKERLLK